MSGSRRRSTSTRLPQSGMLWLASSSSEPSRRTTTSCSSTTLSRAVQSGTRASPRGTPVAMGRFRAFAHTSTATRGDRRALACEGREGHAAGAAARRWLQKGSSVRWSGWWRLTARQKNCIRSSPVGCGSNDGSDPTLRSAQCSNRRRAFGLSLLCAFRDRAAVPAFAHACVEVSLQCLRGRTEVELHHRVR